MPHENENPETGNQALADALSVSFRILRYAMLLVLVVYLFSGVFIVGQHEKAFVLMFGKITGLGEERIKGPGIHWTLPRPFAEVARVATERVQTVETDAFTSPSAKPLEPNVPPPTGPLVPGKDGYTLTGDANLIQSKWAVRYTVADPEAFLFANADAPQILKDELEHAIVKISARMPVDKALRSEIESFRGAVDTELRERADRLHLGIQIQRVDMLALIPPAQVAPAFTSVIEAEQDRSQKISDARAYATRAINEAGGQAAKTRAEGETYKRRMVSEVSADADYFNKIYDEFIKNPLVISRTLLQDTLARTLANVDAKYIVHRNEKGEQELRLQLGPERKLPWEEKK